LNIAIAITVELPDGKLETHEFNHQFQARALQNLDDKNYRDFFMSSVYAEFAQRLRALQQVTQGSFNRVKRVNGGDERNIMRWKWNSRDWKKGDFDVVQIRRIEYTTSKLRIVTKANK
jgi:hypothetical protein